MATTLVRTLVVVLAAVLAVLPVSARADDGVGASWGVVVELRGSALLAPGRAVTIGDVAEVRGEEAERVRAIELAATPAELPAVLEVARLRDALAARGVNLGRTTLRGGQCRVAIGERPAGRERAAVEPARPAESGTVREAVVRRIAQLVGAEPGALALEFQEADGAFLSSPAAGRTIEVRSLGQGDRMGLGVRIFRGDVLESERVVRVGVKVRRVVAVSAAVRKRGEEISAEDVKLEERLVGPTLKVADREKVVGSQAQGRLEPGEIVLERDVAPAVVVSRGEIVAVHSVSGGVVVTTRARARGQARDGELVELEPVDSRDPKRVFWGRMNGRGRAVLAAPEGAGS